MHLNEIKTGYKDLVKLIDMKNSFCLNQKSGKPWTNLFEPGTDTQLHSDDEPEFLLVLPLKAQVRIWGVDFSGPKTDSRPTIVKIFINQPNMSWSDVEDYEPVQILKLGADAMEKGAITKLNFVKFQRVTSVAIFVEDNAGGEFTALSGMSLIGEPTEEMDIKAWEPCKS